MIRVLHISDVHLGARLGGFDSAAAERREAIRAAFRGLPERANALEIDAVLVAGDLFDGTRPASADVDLAREVLRALAADGRPVVAIPGNHDAALAADSPWRAMPDIVTTILEPCFGDPVTLTARGGECALHVYGIAYDPTVEPDPIGGYRRSDAPGVHVVLLHAGVADHPDWTGGASLRTTTAELAGLDADYIALGDYHGHRPPGDFGGPPACYCGSFAAVAVDEVGPRGCAVVELEPGAPPRVRLDPSPVPALVDLGPVDVSDCGDEIEAADRVGALLGDVNAHPVVTLTGEPAFPLDVDRVRDAVRERYGFAVVRDETRFIDSAHVRALAGQPTIAGHVARLGLERRDAAPGDAAQAEAERALRLALRALDAESA